MTAPMIKTNKLSPILKWAGGKEQELKHIHPAMPQKINRYFEPFIGGGAVYFSLDTDEMFINDKSDELINLYKAIATNDKVFFDLIKYIHHNWTLLEKIVENNASELIAIYMKFSENLINDKDLQNWIYSFVLCHSVEFNGMFDIKFNVNIENFLHEIKKNILSKTSRMKKIEETRGKLPQKDILDNLESALKSAFYMHFRYLYNFGTYNSNQSYATAIFFFIRNYAYSGMFRYNKNGYFNVPYGGIGYNRKDLLKKIDYLESDAIVQHLSKTSIENLDFLDFFDKHSPEKEDFIFLDPPYDSEFSTYAQNEFTRADQKRLADYLVNKCKANWMMVIKNTDFIYDLYNKEGINISSFDKKYLVSFQNRNDKDVEHLLITNYKIW